jgi:proteasome accessory factor A
MSLTDSLDWVAKKWLLETFIDEEGVSWDDPWLQSLDLEYHNINQDEGLYYGLEAQELMRRVVTDRQIEHAIHHPPSDTRAYFRGKCLDKFSADVRSVQWDNITFNVRGRPVSVCMKQLADPSLAAEYNRVLNDSPTVESLVNNLGIQN